MSREGAGWGIGVGMLGGPYVVEVGTAPARPVDRARLAAQIGVMDQTAVVVDADSDEVVRVPSLPSGDWRLLALSADGRQLLLLARHGTPPFPDMAWLDGLCVYTLSTGQRRWFAARADGQDVAGALAPDGASIATLSTPDDPDDPSDDGGLAAVGVTDVPTGARRRLWATPGGWSAESAVSWSPGGRLIAVTYLVWVAERGDDYWETVVLDLAGRVVWKGLDARIPQASNGAWISDNELVVVLDNENLDAWVIDVRDSRRRPLGRACQMSCV